MAKDLAAIAKAKNIEYFLISFVDMLGQLRAKLVPARAIKGMQKDGAGFAGFAAWLDMTPAHPDLFAVPDPDSLMQLPWKPEVAWLAADLWMDGKPVEASPRVALKRQLEAAEKKGYRVKTGVECEFFLLNEAGDALSDPEDMHEKPCYDQGALMRRYDVIAQICDGMQVAHENGMLHLDLTPQHVLLNDSGWIKLVDFRMFRPFLHGGVGSKRGGPYLAPELMKDNGVDERAEHANAGARQALDVQEGRVVRGLSAAPRLGVRVSRIVAGDHVEYSGRILDGSCHGPRDVCPE